MNVVLIVFTLLAVMFAVTAISGAPWVPVRAYDVEKLLDDAGVTKGTTYLELGCGDGRLVQAAARRGARAVGYELNPLLWLIAKARCLRTPGATVRLGDFWRVNLGQLPAQRNAKDARTIDVVMAFLVPRTMPRLGLKAAQEMHSSARLVSYVFEIPGVKPAKKGSSWLVYKPADLKPLLRSATSKN